MREREERERGERVCVERGGEEKEVRGRESREGERKRKRGREREGEREGE